MIFPFFKVALLGITGISIPGIYFVAKHMNGDYESDKDKMWDSLFESRLTEQDRKEFLEMEQEAQKGINRANKQFVKALGWLFSNGGRNYKSIIKSILNLTQDKEKLNASFPVLTNKLQELQNQLLKENLEDKSQETGAKSDKRIVSSALTNKLKVLELDKIKRVCTVGALQQENKLDCLPNSLFESIPEIFSFVSELNKNKV